MYWVKDNENSHNGNVSNITSDDITITAELTLHASISDSGTYKCYANNSLGVVEAQVDVLVRG